MYILAQSGKKVEIAPVFDLIMWRNLGFLGILLQPMKIMNLVNFWLIPSWKSVRSMKTPWIRMGFRAYDAFYTRQKLKIHRFCLL